jgi:diguanylate cyclase (GGDEF)-like protein
MPTLLARLLLTALFCCTGLAWAASAGVDGIITLADTTPSTPIETNLDTWIDESSRASIEQVSRNAAKFQSTPALTRHTLTSHDTLWIRLRLARTGGSVAHWTLNIPAPSLDTVTLYQRDSSGAWVEQRSGDKLAQSEWHRPGLYPDFDLLLAGLTHSDVYVAIRNHKVEAVPLRLAPQPQRESQRQRELLGIAMVLGALLSMTMLSALRFAEHRKAIDGWAALFGVLVVVTVAEFAGVMNAFVWSASPKFGDVIASILPVVAVGSTLLFVRSIFAQPLQGRGLYRLTTWIGLATVASVLLFGILDRSLADRVCSAAMLLTTLLSMAATYLGGRSGSTVARWLMIALAPQFLAEMYVVASGLDLVPFILEMRYLMALTVALAVPVLLYALSQVTHDHKELSIRANHLPTQDALTGLLTTDAFQTHLNDSVARAIESREPITLVLVRVINHAHIRQAYGDTTAEQCLLRAVVKLQRILRDVDPAGRVGTAQFAILMEGVSSREAVTERMVKLVASGLIPLPGLVPEVTLHFQAACVLLHNNPVPAVRVLDDLREVLAGMSPNSRRPIRFLEALPTEVSGMHTQDPVEQV